MIKSLKKRIQRESFEPGLLGLIFNPFYFARKGLFENLKKTGIYVTGKTLDVGCGTKPYEKLFSYSEYIGLEYDTGIDSEKKQADYYYDGKVFPFNNEEFDSVVTNQVLEHVFNPGEFLKEIHRVLKSNGKLLLTVPFVWDEHEQPYDYARYSSFGLKHLLESSGFKIIKSEKSTSDFRVIFQMVNGYLYKISRNNFILKQAVQLLLIFPLNIIGTIISFILPGNKDLYLDNIIVAQKL
ncbi:MAG: class I SAM-dependent methyltransferase [Ignavibacteriaceae bacterium]